MSLHYYLYQQGILLSANKVLGDVTDVKVGQRKKCIWENGSVAPKQ